ncbi:MAG: efflux RND transporter periplasmic adaptor subunit [Candidatus Moranbacteria bacterium]|nr:efflux RND transporter periplasmic adaptor subunit [Candidatus Moranbacteria bacterium]
MFTKKTVIIVILLLVMIVGWFVFRSGKEEETVQTETVKRDTVVETVSISGEFVPQKYADIAFAGIGTLENIFVQEGEVVEKGDILATLDRSVIRSQLADARIALAIVVENEKLARRDWNDLKPEERAAKKLASEQAREKVRTIEAQLRESVLHAPFSGQVSKIDMRANEIAGAGKRVLRLVEGNDFVIEARVPESDIVKVVTGMGAKVTFDALSSDDIFQAEVIEIDPSATVVQDVVSYVVTFRLIQNDERLKEGMTADIDIETVKKENVLSVPFRALAKEKGVYYVEVKQGEEFVRVPVTIGLEGDEGLVEITSGLQEGDMVTIGAKQKK